MMIKYALLLGLGFSFSALAGQADSTSFSLKNARVETTGTVIIHQDEKISDLMETISEADIPLEGYRIQLSFGRKEEVNEIRSEFLKMYPECSAYVSWLQPNFRLRVGDFRTRLQAERFKNEIRDNYPSCYIVRDYIEPARE